jgi:hypothetical protein
MYHILVYTFCRNELFVILYTVDTVVTESVNAHRNTETEFNLLKPTCYAMYHQLNIQQLYALPTLYLCVLYLSENKQRLASLAA